MATKRKRKAEPTSNSSQSIGGNPKCTEAFTSSGFDVEELAEFQGENVAKFEALVALFSCRSALVKYPAACRDALLKNKIDNSIDPEFTKALESVATYNLEKYDTPLHECVRRGDAATAQSLILAGANVDAEDSTGVTPLDLATFGSPCRALLEHHADVVAVLTAMPDLLVSASLAHCANCDSLGGAVSMTVLSLRGYHFDASFLWAPDDAREAVVAWARSALMAQLAANTPPFEDLSDDVAGDVLEYFDTAMTRFESLRIVAHCSSPKSLAWVRAVTVADVVEATRGLFHAVLDEEEDFATVQKCFLRGAKVNHEHEGSTALLEACYRGHTASVKLLLDAGANQDGEVYEIDDTPLIAASYQFESAPLELLLQKGAIIEAKNKEGCTGLLMASQFGKAANVKLLLRAGADIEAKDNDGSTALILASIDDHAYTVKLLLKAGAHIDAKDNDGNSALMSASVNGNREIVILLLRAGADVEAKDNSGCTALILASQWGRDDVVKLLLDAGANFEAKDHDGTTALLMASNYDHAAVVKLLLAVGANTNAKDKDGETALDIAIKEEHRDIIDLLQR